MSLFKDKYRIESTRLRDWDYSSPGYYFVTVVVYERTLKLGHIQNGSMILNEFGQIVQKCWEDLPNHYPNFRPDEFIVMPDHLHAILHLIDKSSQLWKTDKPGITHDKHAGLGEIVGALKRFSAREINRKTGQAGRAVWQARFYDHIILSPQQLYFIQDYIRDNPMKWGHDPNDIQLADYIRESRKQEEQMPMAGNDPL